MQLPGAIMMSKSMLPLKAKCGSVVLGSEARLMSTTKVTNEGHSDAQALCCSRKPH